VAQRDVASTISLQQVERYLGDATTNSNDASKKATFADDVGAALASRSQSTISAQRLAEDIDILRRSILNFMIVTDTLMCTESDGACVYHDVRRGRDAYNRVYTPTSEDVVSIDTMLRKRATALKIEANIYLALIFVSLVGGILLFINAGNIAFREQALPSLLEDINRHFMGASGYFDKIREDLRWAGLKAAAESSQPGKDPQRAPTTFPQITSSRPALTTEAVEAMMSRYDSEAALLAHQLKRFADESTNATRSTAFLVSTITTRVGAVAILVFLTQVAISNYRYARRLAAFYEARADAFLLAHDAANAEHLLRILAPDTFDFGAMPKSPTQDAIELAKAIVTKGKTKE